jgi:hypothetical protein
MFGISESAWTITMIIAATLIYVFLIFKRNLRESAGVGIWAFIAILTRQWEAHKGVAITAALVSTILFVLIIYHGFINRHTALFKKISRGEI